MKMEKQSLFRNFMGSIDALIGGFLAAIYLMLKQMGLFALLLIMPIFLIVLIAGFIYLCIRIAYRHPNRLLKE